MAELGYAALDRDNHDDEAPDAFTRHVPRDTQAILRAREPLPDHYLDPDARLAVMDARENGLALTELQPSG